MLIFEVEVIERSPIFIRQPGGNVHYPWRKSSLLFTSILAGVLAFSCARFPREEANPVLTEDLPPTYEGVTPGTMDITKLATLLLPTRIKISPDGELMLVTQLSGEVVLFQKVNGVWKEQATLFYNSEELGVDGERGMTGIFFGAEFDWKSPDPVKRDVFVTYQQFDGSEDRNRITRLTLTVQGEDIVGTDAVMIYQGPEPSASAHQIQDGIGFMYEGAPHFLVELSDGFVPENALDVTKEGHGKLLLMQRDGSDPLGPRPFPSVPKVQAIGLRNTYGILMLPETIDPLRRVLGAENGNETQDRIWLVEAVDFGHEVDGQLSLQYEGTDQGPTWISFPDVNTIGSVKREGVLMTIKPTISPTAVALHPGGGIIPVPGPNQAVFVMGAVGKPGEVANDPGKDVHYGVISNLDGQPTLTIERIIRRTPQADGHIGNLVPVEVDPTTGNIYFADIITGEVDEAVLK